MLFFVVIFAITLGDVLWWILAHRAARRFARPRVWQPMIAAFSIAQLSYIIFFVIAPVMARRTHLWTPMPIVVAIYLWHLLFRHFLRHVQMPWSWLWGFCFFAGSIVFGILAAKLIEMPALRLRDKMFPAHSGSIRRAPQAAIH